MFNGKSKTGKLILIMSTLFIIGLLFSAFPAYVSADEGPQDQVPGSVDESMVGTDDHGQNTGDSVEFTMAETSASDQDGVTQEGNGTEGEDNKPWGFILDTETKQPIAGALVVLNEQDNRPQDQRDFTTTDLDGSFSFDKDPKENYTIEISADGYETIEVPVNTQTFDIFLQPVNPNSEENNPVRDNEDGIEENTDQDNLDESEREDDTQFDSGKGPQQENNTDDQSELSPHFYINDEKHSFSSVQDAINAASLQPIEDN
ncbi:MAG: carboxypeptidase regulatory-like domain-containing protein, partial [Mahellales bacterium]